MKNTFITRSGAIALVLTILFCGISTFGFSAYVLTEHSTMDWTLLDVGKSSFQKDLLSVTQSLWFVGLALGFSVFVAFRWIWIIRECDKWNNLLHDYIAYRKTVNSLSNYQEADLNRAFLEPDINMFLNMNLWRHKQMKYCSFIHNDVMQYHSKLNNAI